jgi:hypothetical protein
MFRVASLPTFIAISSRVNNDNLATMLYAAGVYWTLRIFKRHEIKNRDIVILSAILGLISIAKLTGLSLYGIVYLGMVIGVRRGHFTRRSALQMVGWSLAAFVIIAGWWYARNIRLYGDPFALDATANLWGRQFEISPTSGNIGEELLRIGKSFWMMFGHLHNPVFGPDWLYIYAAIATAVGVVGVGATFRRTPEKRDVLLLMTAVCVVVGAMLLAGTRTVDISYGRLLFPALVGFAPLMIVGWRRLLGRYVSAALIVPFSVIAFIAPMRELPEGYLRLTAVDALPVDATPLNVAAGDLAFVAYDMDDKVVEPGDRLTFDLYLRGANPSNPYVSATLVDPISSEQIGYTAIYPGIAPTEALDPDKLYRAKVWIDVDEGLDAALSPRQLRLRLAWRDPGTFSDLRLMNDAGFDSNAILVDAATLLDKRYEPPEPEYPVEAKWESIALEGYSLSEVDFSPGEALTATFVWDAIHPMDDNWLYTVQLFSADGDFITQADGVPEGYPPTAWIVNRRFADSRTLTIPEDTPPGDYWLYIGWYRIAGVDEFVRMAIDREDAENNLFTLPQMITVADS